MYPIDKLFSQHETEKEPPMDYEELYAALTSLTGELETSLSQSKKLLKAIDKDLAFGNLEDLLSSSEKLQECAVSLQKTAEETRKKVSSFDAKSYISSGDYAAQMLTCFREEGIDVSGEYPVYEVFPCRVKLDEENQEVIIDKKRFACLRPKKLVELVKAIQDRLNKASFNAQTFVNELYDAYSLSLLKGKKTEGTDIYLTVLYKALVPMSRSRKDYDMQSFAFDLARLYQVRDTIVTRDNHHFQFGSSRNASKAIRILDADGQEQFLCTISFYR